MQPDNLPHQLARNASCCERADAKWWEVRGTKAERFWSGEGKETSTHSNGDAIVHTRHSLGVACCGWHQWPGRSLSTVLRLDVVIYLGWIASSSSSSSRHRRQHLIRALGVAFRCVNFTKLITVRSALPRPTSCRVFSWLDDCRYITDTHSVYSEDRSFSSLSTTHTGVSTYSPPLVARAASVLGVESPDPSNEECPVL